MSPRLGGLSLVSVVFMVVNFPSVMIWAAAGQGLRRWLEDRSAASLQLDHGGAAGGSLWPVVTMEM